MAKFFNVEDSDAKQEQTLLDEFKTAAFGTECRTISFVENTQGSTQKVWLDASQVADGSWTISKNTENTDTGIVEVIVIDAGSNFFSAVQTLAEFERSTVLNDGIPSGDDTEESLGILHYKEFGVREAIAFEANTGLPVQTENGKVVETGEFTSSMLAAVKQAHHSKQSIFRLPAMDIMKSLGNPSEKGTDAQDLIDQLKNKESFPHFVGLFQEYIKLYKEAAKGGFLDRHDNERVEDAHNEVEEKIDLFPSGKWPDKDALTALLANTHIYFTMQSLQARFQDAHKNDRSSEFLQDVVLIKLKSIQNYYAKRTSTHLPSEAVLLDWIINPNNTIEGFPPREVMEHFNILKGWARTLKTGVIMGDAVLPEIKPVEFYIPDTLGGERSLGQNLAGLQNAEDVVRFAKSFDTFLGKYQDYLTGDLGDRYAHEELSDAHTRAEELAIHCPENPIIEREELIKLMVKSWVSVELKRLKHTEGEVTADVDDKLIQLMNYYERVMSENVKGYKKDKKFRTGLIAEAKKYISDPTTKIPDTVEVEFIEARDRLMEFVTEFKASAVTKKKGSPAPRP